MTPAAPDTVALARRLLETHPESCNAPTCPFAYPNRPLVVADRFRADSDGNGGWGHRRHFTGIGTLGEYVVHLAIPEIQLTNGLSTIPSPMDGVSPQGSTEIKAATLQTGPDGELQRAYTIRPTQRQPHALPAVFVALDDGFVPAFDGRPLELPGDLIQVVRHVEAVHVVPLAAYPDPQRTFIVPAERSSRLRTQALQTLFRFSMAELEQLGLRGLGMLRAIYDSERVVERCMRFLTELLDRLDPDELAAYRLDPRLLLADAQAFEAEVALNERVSEALALRELRRREAHRKRRRIENTRERSERQRQARREEQRRERIELAFALIGILTAVAERPISALEMRNRFGLPRDQLYPPDFGEEARARGVAVCLPGERRRVTTEDGTRIRHLTQQERQDLRRRLPEWLERVRGSRSHPLVRRVLRLWSGESKDEPGQLAYQLIQAGSGDAASTQGTLDFGWTRVGGLAVKSRKDRRGNGSAYGHSDGAEA